MKKIFLLIFIFLLSAPGFILSEEIGLPVGAQAPDFFETAHNNERFLLSDTYKDGPIVLIFYRGGWCVYCNRQLQSYQQNLDRFEKLGARVVAVSVDTLENAVKTVEEKELGFTVISNPKANTLEKYNLVYYVPDELARTYKEQYAIDLEAASGRTDHLIAIPATYVIDTHGKIIFASANKDYKVRVSVEDVLSFLGTLSSESE